MDRFIREEKNRSTNEFTNIDFSSLLLSLLVSPWGGATAQLHGTNCSSLSLLLSLSVRSDRGIRHDTCLLMEKLCDK